MSKLQYIFIAILLCLTMTTKASQTEDDMAKANAAYRAADYYKAVELYNRIVKNSPSAEAYYNLGNAYYRIENLPRAILNYEKAARLSPSNADIEHNIEIANSKTIDKLPPVTEFFFIQWYRCLQSMQTIDSWANIALSALIIALLLFLSYLFMNNMLVRRCSFYVSALSLIVFVLTNLLAWQRKNYIYSHDSAIVMNETVSVKVSPTSKAADAYTLHEGSKVHITDKDMEGWLGIRLSDGREGWIKKQDVEEI